MPSPAPTPPRPLLPSARRALAALTGALLAACGSGGASRPVVPPEQIEQIEGFGALELVTHFRRERGGDAAGFGMQQVPHWTLRWQGQPVVIDAPGGLFGDGPQQLAKLNAVFVIEHAEGLPALLVNVGNANNTSSFHLVRPHGDALQVRLLCIAGAGDNAVGWAQQVQRRADGDAALPARTAWLHGPLRETLSARPDGGGRYLQLGRRCLLDTRSGEVRWLPVDPEDASVLAGGPTLVSPDGTRLARLGLAETAGADARPLLLVAEPMTLAADMVPGSVAAHQAARQGAGWQRIELDRMHMRFPTLHAVDAAWVLHHFRWERTAQGERLAERRGFAPLPHRGVFADGHAEYRLEALREDLRQRLVDFLVQRFDGRPVAGGSGEFGAAVRVGAQTVTVHDTGFYIAPSGKPYFPGQPEDPQVQRALVHRLGEAFDAELAGGRLDHLFAAAAATR